MEGWQTYRTMHHSSRLSMRVLPFLLLLPPLAACALAGFGGWISDRNPDIGLAVLLVAGAVLASWIAASSRGARKGLQELFAIRSVLERLSHGELGARIPMGCRIRELEGISRSVNGLGEANASLVQELRDGSLALERELETFQREFAAIRARSEANRTSAGTVAAAMEELGAGAGSIANETESVALAATEACGLSERLNDLSRGTSEGISRQYLKIQETGKQLEAATESAHELARRGREISGIATSITDVSKRLRLLALNASIEAAKSGESGRGFAVVAQEVKDLADQAGAMATRIQGKVEAVVQGTETVTADLATSGDSLRDLLEEGTRSVEVVERQAALALEAKFRLEDTTRNLSSISRTLEESRRALDEIGRTSHELDRSSEGIVAALQVMDTGLLDLERLSGSFRTSVADLRSPVVFFPWTEDLSVRVPRMDDQHRVLLRLTNRVADLAASGGSGSAIRTILGQLADYTKFHFAEEERFMEGLGYPDLPAHRRIHASLVDQVVSLLQRLDAGEDVPIPGLLEFLRNWLIQHIQGEDGKYCPVAPPLGATPS